MKYSYFSESFLKTQYPLVANTLSLCLTCQNQSLQLSYERSIICNLSFGASLFWRGKEGCGNRTVEGQSGCSSLMGTCQNNLWRTSKKTPSPHIILCPVVLDSMLFRNNAVITERLPGWSPLPHVPLSFVQTDGNYSRCFSCFYDHITIKSGYYGTRPLLSSVLWPGDYALILTNSLKCSFCCTKKIGFTQGSVSLVVWTNLKRHHN